MDNLLKPIERKRVQEALAACSECASLHEALRRIPGVDIREDERRREAAENRIRGIIDVDRIISKLPSEDQ